METAYVVTHICVVKRTTGVSGKKQKHTCATYRVAIKKKKHNMSYITSFVQAQEATKVVATEPKTIKTTAKPATKSNMGAKILLFVGIITCLVLAVTI